MQNYMHLIRQKRMKKDISDKENQKEKLQVKEVENEEGPALGGAMLAAVGCGEYPDVETAAAKIVKVVDTVGPDEELTAKYEERYAQFKQIYPTVKELFGKLK